MKRYNYLATNRNQSNNPFLSRHTLEFKHPFFYPSLLHNLNPSEYTNFVYCSPLIVYPFDNHRKSIFMEAYFAHLEKNFKNRPSLQIEMFDIFLEQLPLAIEQMGKGLETDDLKMFHYDAHRIKSTINIIGLPKLKPLITKMDEYCYKHINLEELPNLYKEFKIQAAEDVVLIHAQKKKLQSADMIA